MVDIIEGYETEEQQVDAIKKWWSDNGNTLIIGAVIGLAGLWGWRYYGESVLTAQEKASTAYADVLINFEANGEQATEDVQLFIADNEGNNYATLASLLLAKEAVKANDFALAKTQLTALLASNSYQPLTPVITLRLARIEAQLGEYEQALVTVNKITEKGFVVKAEQTKAAIYLQQGNVELARIALQAAVAASEGRVDPLLQLQLDDIAMADVEVAPVPKLDAAQ